MDGRGRREEETVPLGEHRKKDRQQGVRKQEPRKKWGAEKNENDNNRIERSVKDDDPAQAGFFLQSPRQQCSDRRKCWKRSRQTEESTSLGGVLRRPDQQHGGVQQQRCAVDRQRDAGRDPCMDRNAAISRPTDSAYRTRMCRHGEFERTASARVADDRRRWTGDTRP